MARGHTLRSSLLWRFILTTAVPLVLVGSVAQVYLERTTRQTIVTENAALAESLAWSVHAELHEAEAILGQVAEFVAEGVTVSASDAAVTRVLDRSIARSGFFESVYLVGPAGTIEHVGLTADRSRSRQDYIGLDLSHSPYVAKTLADRQPVWTDAFQSVVTGELSLTLSIPDGDGAMVANFSVARLSQLVRGITAGRLIDAMIIDQGGHLIFHRDQELASQKQNLRNIDLVRYGLVEESANGNFELGGEVFFGSSHRIPDIGWIVVVSQPRASAMAPIIRTRALFMAGMLAALAIAVVVANTISKRLTRPLEQVGTSAQAMAGGMYEAAIPAQRHLEVERLAQSLRDLARAIEAREKTLNELAASMVSARGREVMVHVVNAVARVLLVDYAQVSELTEDGRIEPVATLVDGELVSLPRLPMTGSEFDIVLNQGFFVQHRGASAKINCRHLPGDLEIEGFIGMTLEGTDGQAVGILCAGSRSELDIPPHAWQSLRIIASRAVAEIEQRRLEHTQTELEEQLNQAQRMEALGRLAGGVAHDFNNVLQAIQGYTSLSIELAEEGSELHTFLDEVMMASKRAADLTRQLLTFSRRDSFRPELLDLNDVVAGLMKMIRRVIGEDVELTVIPAHEVPLVLADHRQIEQVLVNLCVNARDAIEDGGTITVSTSTAVKAETTWVILKVSDNGTGIAPEFHSKIFEPFFTTKEVGRGTGLGLSTVFAIVDRHHGSIEFSSEPQVGTTFTVSLPADVGESEPPEDRAVDVARVRTDSGTILVVEDDEQVRALATRVLRSAGFDLVIAHDGEEALTRFSNDPDAIDLVVSDVVMPKMSGPIACARMRELKPELRILFCSGYSSEVDDVRSIEDEAGEILRKPFTGNELLERVRELIST